MITIYYGEDYINAYKAFTKNITKILEVNEAIQNLSSYALFKPVKVEDIGVKVENPTELKRLLDTIKTDSKISIYASFNIKATQKNKNVKYINKSFGNNFEIFNFLDNCFAGNKNLVFKQLEKFINEDQHMYLISMFFYYFKNVLNYHINSDNFNKLTFRNKDKFSNIARKLDLKKNKSLIKTLAVMDIKIKQNYDKDALIISYVNYIIKICQ